MNAIISGLLTMFGKAGLKAVLNALVSSDLFKDAVVGLITGRVQQLKVERPELYARLEETAHVIAGLPAVLTDDNPNDGEQVASSFTIQARSDVSAVLIRLEAANSGNQVTLSKNPLV